MSHLSQLLQNLSFINIGQNLPNLPLAYIEPLLMILKYNSSFERSYNESMQLENYFDKLLTQKLERVCQTKETINTEFSIGEIIVMYVSC